MPLVFLAVALPLVAVALIQIALQLVPGYCKTLAREPPPKLRTGVLWTAGVGKRALGMVLGMVLGKNLAI